MPKRLSSLYGLGFFRLGFLCFVGCRTRCECTPQPFVAKALCVRLGSLIAVISMMGTLEILKAIATFEAAGHCIYCGTKQGPLSDEHIVPFGLGGTLVLPKASCKACATETAKLEQVIQRMMLGPSECVLVSLQDGLRKDRLS